MIGPIRIGVVTVSDRASRGEYEDLGGPAVQTGLREMLSCPWEPVARVIPDEQEHIESTLRALADDEGCCLIVTTGGTGPARRDVTPEATVAVYRAFKAGDHERARRLQMALTPLAIAVTATYGVAGLKAAVTLSGRQGGVPRPPLATATEGEVAEIKRLMDASRAAL